MIANFALSSPVRPLAALSRAVLRLRLLASERLRLVLLRAVCRLRPGGRWRVALGRRSWLNCDLLRCATGENHHQLGFACAVVLGEDSIAVGCWCAGGGLFCALNEAAGID